MRFFGLSIVLLSQIVFAAAGTTRRVPQEYKSIQKAVDAAKVGDTVLVDEGIYYENIRIVKNIVVASRFILDGDTTHISRTVIDGSKSRNLTRASVVAFIGEKVDSSAVLIGFSIRGGKGTYVCIKQDTMNYHSMYGAGVCVLSNGASILHNRIFDNHLDLGNDTLLGCGGGIGGYIMNGSRQRLPFVIRHNVIEGNSVLSIRSFGGGINAEGPAIIENNIVRMNHINMTKDFSVGGGIYAGSIYRDTFWIASNLIEGNYSERSAGIFVGGEDGRLNATAWIVNNIIRHNSCTERGGGIGIAYGDEVSLINNTIIHNRSGGYGSGIDNYDTEMCLMNNIIYGNEPGEQISCNMMFPASHNLVQNGFPGIATMDLFPKFLDDTAGMQLSDESPCVGSGIRSMIAFGEQQLAPATDFFGRQRGVFPKQNPDLGAVESPFAGSPQQQENPPLKITINIHPLSASEQYMDPATEFIHTTACTFFINDTIPITDSLRNAGIALYDYDTPLFIEIIGKSSDSRMIYRTSLGGRDYGWLISAKNRFLILEGLRSGRYEFRIQSKKTGHEKPWVESSIGIIVPHPWWEQWWFYVLLIGGTIALVSIFYRRELFRARREKVLQQEFMQKQIEAQEAERKRVSAELHDGLGQDLFVVNSILQQYLNDPSYSVDDLRSLTGLMQESIEAVREISSNLHPHHLERLGFCAAIEVMVEKLSHSSPIRFVCRCDAVDELMPDESEIHIFRIIQESLSNIVKHSDATEAELAIYRKNGSIEITIRDNGKGFEAAYSSPQRADQARGFGLASMTERVRIIGGQIFIESKPGKGTHIRIDIPTAGT